MLRKCNRVFIILGDECNMGCRYCIQHPIIHRQRKVELNPDVIKWIDDLAALSDEMLTVCFFGGEPLLYFDAIKKIVGFHKQTNIQYRMITNGRALTREMVDFFNSHHVYLNISWDGDNVKETRGYDVFDRERGNWDNLMALDSLGVNAVISSKTYPYDALKAMQRIDDAYYELHRSHIYVHTDFIFGCNLPDPSMADIDYDKLKRQMEAILEEYDRYVRGGKADPCIVQWMAFYLEGYLWAMSHDASPYCQNGREILNVDIKGNLYFCHNTRDLIGTIYSNTDRYTARVDALERNVGAQKERCSKCYSQKMCRMCCKLIPPDKLEDHYCRLRREAFRPIVDYVENTLAGYAEGGL